MSRLRTLVAALAVTLLASGCGQDTGTTTGSEPSPGGGSAGSPGQPLLQVEQTGGFRPAGATFASLPELTVLADGRALTPGPQPATYPGPALPDLRVHLLDEAQLAELGDLARNAGLLAPPPDYGQSLMADATTTVVRLHVDGQAYEHQVYALGFETGPPGGATEPPGPASGLPGELRPLPGAGVGFSPEAQAARDRVSAFLDAARQVVESTGPGQAYVPEALAVQARPAVAGGAGPEPVEPSVRPWPLPGVELAGAVDCHVVTGDDATTLVAALREASALTRFEQSGVRWTVAVRPLLPGESSC